MNILVCVKRVPETGGRIVLTPDGQEIDRRYLGFTVSPHEECAVEEAVRIVEARGGSSAVLTLGPAAAEEQLRDALAIGIDRAVLLESDGADWDPVSTAAAIARAIRDQESANGPFDMILFGNESADNAGFQVGIRVAVALGRPVINGIKGLEVQGDTVRARREAPGGGWETYELPIPAVIGVKEGINLPRYPTMKGRLASKKVALATLALDAPAGGQRSVRLHRPEEEASTTEILGHGPEAAAAVVDLLVELGLLSEVGP